jgi:uncharacterized protein (TIGR02147 family)
MESQQQFQSLLREKLVERQLKNPAYSLRAFARAVNLNPAALSMILNGKRRVSKSLADRVAENLMLEPQQRERLLALFDHENPETSQDRVVELRADEFQLISQWHHFAILSLAETQDFQSDVAWIARRLGISKSTAQQAIDRLVRLEMLRQTSDGRIETTGLQYKTTSDVADVSLRKSHFTNLELARASLESDPLDQRDFSAMTMAVDPSLLPQAKSKIREFRRELSAFLESGSKKEIYKLCVQLFPLSKQGE